MQVVYLFLFQIEDILLVYLVCLFYNKQRRHAQSLGMSSFVGTLLSE